MNDLRETAKQALERLRKYHYGNGFAEDAECIADLEAALAQQAEPVQDRHRACPTHCCPVHGCKYGHDDCPVAAGAVQPVYPRNNGCESCADDALAQQTEPVESGAWVASKDGRVIYDDASTDDGLLRVSGDFENDEQRVRYAQRIVDKLNAAPPQRTMVPLTEDEIYYATGHCGVSRYTAIKIARVVEEASWEKNHG